MKIEIIEPHGMCAGVRSAIAAAMKLENAWCLHELVHNELVIGELRERGFRFVESVEEIPVGETVVFSAHGVSPQIREAAKRRHLDIVDTTCPFVARVHREAREFSERGLPVVVIGDPDHAEVRGILGEICDKRKPVRGGRIGVVSQTTMNAEDVEKRIAELRRDYEVVTAARVCNTTQERQDAVRRFCAGGGGVLVLGSAGSSNTCRLIEVASRSGSQTFAAATMDEVRSLDFKGVSRLGVTSGASTPESFFNRAVAHLKTVAAAAFVMLSLAAGAETNVIDGVSYVCEDGVCRRVDMPVRTAAAPSEGSVRFAYGYMNADEFMDFLGGRSRSDYFDGMSWWLIALLVLAGGFALNLTPCVLPMVPVTIMVIGRSAARGLAYGAGIVLAYGTLGVMASVGSVAFGTVQSGGWFNLAVSLVFVALALALFGAYNVDFSRFRRIANGGAFLTGLLSAVLAGACVAPVLVAVLLLTARLFAAGRMLALLLPFLLGIGMALPWPFVGAGLSVLPKPGAWMRHVNRVFAVVMLGIAAWYGNVAARAFLFDGEVRSESVGVDGFRAVLADAKRPVLVDCWASWCKNCAVMERTTLKDRKVLEALRGYTVIRLQAEDIDSLRRLPGFENVRGLPAFAVIRD